MTVANSFGFGKYLHNFVLVHDIANEVVDISQACSLSFGRRGISAVSKSHSDNIATFGIPRQPLNTPIGGPSRDYQDPNAFYPQKGIQFRLIKSAGPYLGDYIVVGRGLKFVYDLRARTPLDADRARAAQVRCAFIWKRDGWIGFHSRINNRD